MDFVPGPAGGVGIGGEFLYPCCRPGIEGLDSTARTGSLLGGVFHREFYRCDDRASASGVASTALSLAIQLCHHRGVGFRALGRLALALPFSRAAAWVVRCRADL